MIVQNNQIAGTGFIPVNQNKNMQHIRVQSLTLII